MHSYLAKTKPNPPTNRVPWNRYIVPCYLALFFWYGFFEDLSRGTIDRAPFGLLFLGLVVAGLFSYGALYWIPARMGMQTGYPTGVLGSSTFGSRGGRLAPGLLAALVQGAWVGIAGYFGAKALAAGLGMDTAPRGAAVLVVAAILGLAFTGLSLLPIGWISRMALAVVPLGALVLVGGLYLAEPGLPEHGLDLPEPYAAFTLTIHLATAFFAAIALVSPGVTRYAGSVRDLKFGGFFGIAVATVVGGGLSMLVVAGSRALNPELQSAGEFGFLAAIEAVAGSGAPVVAFVLLLGSIPAAASFAWNSVGGLSRMAPELPKPAAIAVIGAIAAGTAGSGVAANMYVVLTVSGAICAPICGIMAADYWQHEKRWPHTRPGVNYAGYLAWLAGLGVGLVPLLPLPEHILSITHPAAVFSCVTGFVGYILFANMGLKPYRKHRRRKVRSEEFRQDPQLTSTHRQQASRHHHASHIEKPGSEPKVHSSASPAASSNEAPGDETPAEEP